MFKEKPIAISENRILTNKGRLFESFTDYNNKKVWIELELPNFLETKKDIPKGKTKFIESISPKEKWDKAESLADLIQ